MKAAPCRAHHVSLDQGYWGTAARDDAIRPRPEHRPPVQVPQLPAEVSPDQPAAGRLHIVDEAQQVEVLRKGREDARDQARR